MNLPPPRWYVTRLSPQVRRNVNHHRPCLSLLEIPLSFIPLLRSLTSPVFSVSLSRGRARGDPCYFNEYTPPSWQASHLIYMH